MKVFPYAFRHSYAQRLADEGASESELMDLMDHDSFNTTRGVLSDPRRPPPPRCRLGSQGAVR